MKPLRRPAFGQNPADALPGARIGFAKCRGAAQHEGMTVAQAKQPPHIPNPSLDLRPGFCAGPPLPLHRLRQGFAHGCAQRAAHTGFCNIAPWWAGHFALDCGVITTLNGGSLSCGKPLFFWPFLRFRPLPVACKPMVSAPWPVRRPVRLLPMRPIRIWLPAQPLAGLQAPIATISTFRAARRATERRSPRAFGRELNCNRAIGGHPPVALALRILKSAITKGGAGGLAPEGRD